MWKIPPVDETREAPYPTRLDTRATSLTGWPDLALTHLRSALINKVNNIELVNGKGSKNTSKYNSNDQQQIHNKITSKMLATL